MTFADPRQFDMFAEPAPEPPAVETPHDHDERIRAWAPKNMVGRAKFGNPMVQTRAATHDGIITLYSPDAPEPFEVEVRGIPCVIAYSGGFCTHAINPAGSLFWSETGFRSFGRPIDDPAEIIAEIEAFIEGPTSYGNGCGGKLVRWWPCYIHQWRQSLAFELECAKDRADVWAQWGPAKHAEHWANHDSKLAAAIEQMRADGIDPNDVGPPSQFRGKWPSFA